MNLKKKLRMKRRNHVNLLKLLICQFVGIDNNCQLSKKRLSICQHCQKKEFKKKILKKKLLEKEKKKNLSICPFVNLSQLSICQLVEIVILSKLSICHFVEIVSELLIV